MKLETALKLSVGDTVLYPADRGDPAGYGKVTIRPDGPINKDNSGNEFIWIEIYQPTKGHKSVWPTNRLSS